MRSNTWWGQKFIEALESFTDRARLVRGKSYANSSRIIDFKIESNIITARIRGNKNSYYGVYEEPIYTSIIKFKKIPKNYWQKFIQKIGSNPSFITRLLMDELPDNISHIFNERYDLLPKRTDLETECSCPDWKNPCKHIAGLYYRIATLLDYDPFLLFQFKGMNKTRLQQELKKTEMGQPLINNLADKSIPRTTATQAELPKKQIADVDNMTFGAFWGSKKHLDSENTYEDEEENCPAILIKKGGNYPPFWEDNESFISVMESFYQQFKKSNALLRSQKKHLF